METIYSLLMIGVVWSFKECSIKIVKAYFFSLGGERGERHVSKLVPQFEDHSVEATSENGPQPTLPLPHTTRGHLFRCHVVQIPPVEGGDLVDQRLVAGIVRRRGR